MISLYELIDEWRRLIVGAGGIGLVIALPVGYAAFEGARKAATLIANGIDEKDHPSVVNLQPGQSVTIGDTVVRVPND